jgi:hypothetical protein
MNIRNLSKRMTGIISVLTLAFGIGIGSHTTSYGQGRSGNGGQNRDGNDDRYGNYGGSSQLRQTALNAGYNEGMRQAANDRQKGGYSNYRDLDVYQNATKDYSSHLGDRETYRLYFREAFERGYSQGYSQGSNNRNDRYKDGDRSDNGKQGRRGRNWDGYGNFGGSFHLRQTALNAGYNEGIKQGHNDRNKRYDNGYQNQSAYKKATKDYSSRLGDRQIYQHYFRDAYETGYRDGVNGY